MDVLIFKTDDKMFLNDVLSGLNGSGIMSVEAIDDYDVTEASEIAGNYVILHPCGKLLKYKNDKTYEEKLAFLCGQEYYDERGFTVEANGKCIDVEKIDECVMLIKKIFEKWKNSAN